MKFFPFLFLASLSAYAAPVKFTPMGDGEYGYKIVDEFLYVKEGTFALFEGNAETSLEYAQIFSRLAAYQHCHQQKKLAVLYGDTNYRQKELSPKKPESLIGYAQPFFCLKNVRKVVEFQKANFMELPAQLIEKHVKDNKTAMMVSNENLDSGPIRDKDIIIDVDGLRIEKHSQLPEVLDNVKDLKPVVRLIRNDKIVTVKVTIEDSTKEGTKLTRQNIKNDCQSLDKKSRPDFCSK